ncbi:MAG: D-alanine--D-alanine ligase family protein [Anaerolineaceae bacterium]
MAEKINIGVIFGGRSGEHEVSLMSARSVLSVLDPSKYNIFEIGITHEGAWFTGKDVLSAFEQNSTKNLFPAVLLPEPQQGGTLYTIGATSVGNVLKSIAQLDVIFPVLHGTFGEDGTLQGMLELADVAYIGAGVLGASVGMDKILFKDVMIANHIPVVDSVNANRSEILTAVDGLIARIEKKLSYPVFVKPANMGSSVGVTKCRTRSDLLEGLMDAAQYDRRILIEHGVNGREIEVSVLGNDDAKASVVGEIRPSDDFYSYDAKYIHEGSELLIPAPIDAEMAKKVQELAVRAYTAIDCSGMARVDFLLDRDTNELFLNEINTIPGFTKISMYPKLWAASGIAYPELVQQLIDLAVSRKADRDTTVRTYRSGK